MSRVANDDRGFSPVPPRVLCSEVGETRPLVDVLQTLVSSEEHAVVRIDGCGTTTAIKFVLDRFDAGCFAVVEPKLLAGDVRECRFLLVGEPVRAADHVFTLAAWDVDDFIQYLMLNHADHAQSVMARVLRSKQMRFAHGSPAVWRNVLDLMVDQISVESPKDVCLTWLAEELAERTGGDLLTFADCLLAQGIAAGMKRLKSERLIPSDLYHVVDDEDVQFLIIASRVADRLKKQDSTVLRHWFSRACLAEIAILIKGDESAADCLKGMVRRKQRGGLAASLLLKTVTAWRPPSQPGLDFHCGDLRGAQWAGCYLHRANLSRADLSDADLKRADLQSAKLIGATVVRANLQECNLNATESIRAKFNHVNLSEAQGVGSEFTAAKLCNADMSYSNFVSSKFVETDFSGANLAGACFDNCDFRQALVAETDFTRTSFKQARLTGTNFTSSILAYTNFKKADLRATSFEDAELNRCNFTAANLTRSLLTGSLALGADFTKANLREAGLAEIVWENCDLRAANLAGVAFHMGSTRCGLVGSPYPSHGTRTGFYTDDHEDLYYKQPELVRKAALIGCDLRGANILEVDFYLVDLRGSTYDPSCRHHLEQCGAILD